MDRVFIKLVGVSSQSVSGLHAVLKQESMKTSKEVLDLPPEEDPHTNSNTRALSYAVVRKSAYCEGKDTYTVSLELRLKFKTEWGEHAPYLFTPSEAILNIFRAVDDSLLPDREVVK